MITKPEIIYGLKLFSYILNAYIFPNTYVLLRKLPKLLCLTNTTNDNIKICCLLATPPDWWREDAVLLLLVYYLLFSSFAYYKLIRINFIILLKKDNILLKNYSNNSPAVYFKKAILSPQPSAITTLCMLCWYCTLKAIIWKQY